MHLSTHFFASPFDKCFGSVLWIHKVLLSFGPRRIKPSALVQWIRSGVSNQRSNTWMSEQELYLLPFGPYHSTTGEVLPLTLLLIRVTSWNNLSTTVFLYKPEQDHPVNSINWRRRRNMGGKAVHPEKHELWTLIQDGHLVQYRCSNSRHCNNINDWGCVTGGAGEVWRTSNKEAMTPAQQLQVHLAYLVLSSET